MTAARAKVSIGVQSAMLPTIQVICVDSRVIFPAFWNRVSIWAEGASGYRFGLYVWLRRSTGIKKANGIGDNRYSARDTGAVSGRGIMMARSAVGGAPRRTGAVGVAAAVTVHHDCTAVRRFGVSEPAWTWTTAEDFR